jgi:hypothetical protein
MSMDDMEDARMSMNHNNNWYVSRLGFSVDQNFVLFVLYESQV